MTKRATIDASNDARCAQSHYAVIVDAQKDVEVYQLGDVDCSDCLRRMITRHEAIAEVFRERLRGPDQVQSGYCRVYDALCLNPSYCDARDACCAGDPDCQPEDRAGSGPEEAP